MSTDYLKRILTSRSTTSPSNRRWSRPAAVAAAVQHGAAQARGHPGRVQLQAARGLQQDGQPAARRAQPRRDRGLGWQPCARRGAGGHAAGLPRGHRHAHHQPAGEGGRGAPPGRRGGAGRREFLRCLRPRAGAGKEGKADLRASVRRSRRDRRPGHGGHGDPAPASRSHRRHLRGHRRRRADLGRGRLHQAAAPRSRSSACRPRTPTPCCAACARAGACS